MYTVCMFQTNDGWSWVKWPMCIWEATILLLFFEVAPFIHSASSTNTPLQVKFKHSWQQPFSLAVIVFGKLQRLIVCLSNTSLTKRMLTLVSCMYMVIFAILTWISYMLWIALYNCGWVYSKRQTSLVCYTNSDCDNNCLLIYVHAISVCSEHTQVITGSISWYPL